jgi:hypothetical protein
MVVELKSTERRELNMPMVNTAIFKDKMRRGGHTFDTLCKVIGRSRTGLFNKVHNKHEFTLKEIALISEELKLSKSDREKIFFASDVE